MKWIFEAKTWAIFSAILVPVLILFSCFGYRYLNWSFEDSTSFASAYAGTLAAFSGFLFIYVSFKEQQNQFNIQQEHILRQGFEIGLNDLINKLLLITREKLPTNPKKELMPYLKQFEKEYISSIDAIELILPDLKKSDKKTFIPSHYLEAFKSSIRGIKEIIKSFIGILYFIEIGEVQNKERYYSLLFNQMSQAEVRVIFYGYFHQGFQLNTKEKALLKNFFLKFNGRELLDSSDIDLM